MKLSLKEMFNEADALQRDQNLKFNILQKLPQYMKMLMSQIKSDQYDQAIQTLNNIAAAAEEARDQLTHISQQGSNNPQAPKMAPQNISNKEI